MALWVQIEDLELLGSKVAKDKVQLDFMLLLACEYRHGTAWGCVALPLLSVGETEAQGWYHSQPRAASAIGMLFPPSSPSPAVLTGPTGFCSL